jgi:SAM-dependent methyltransferase
LQTAYDLAGRLREYHEKRFDQAGDSAEGVGWKSKQLQELLFRVIESMGIREDSSVLDVGCGLGHLYSFLSSRGFRGQYTGIDLCPVLIEQARLRLPGADFRSGDFLQDQTISGRYDFVITSGLFCTRFDMDVHEYERFVEAMIRKMFDISQVGIIFNMLTTDVDFQSSELFYAEPMKYFKLLKSITKYTTIKHDYPSFFFTCAAYRHGNDYGI